jgi:hypothetical protein
LVLKTRFSSFFVHTLVEAIECCLSQRGQLRGRGLIEY